MKVGFVSLIGRPNAGKSTLVNRVVGTKLAIVSDKPQTTRNRILAVRNYSDDPAAQVIFVDTPGIHRPLHRMNVRMVGMALESMGDVDVIGLVRDATDSIGAGDRFVLRSLEAARAPVILVLNKIDRIAKSRLLPLIDWYRRQRELAAVVPISALTGDGVEILEREIIQQLPEGEPLYPDDFLTDQISGHEPNQTGARTEPAGATAATSRWWRSLPSIWPSATKGPPSPFLQKPKSSS